MADLLYHRSCRACAGDLAPVVDLGTLHLNAFPASPAEIPNLPATPLELVVCLACSLVQLRHTTPPEQMFTQYWYRSSVNESMVAELQKIVEHACSLVQLQRDDWVMDIGANDGTLLRSYLGLRPWLSVVAVEPAANLQERLSAAVAPFETHLVVHGFFPTAALEGAKAKFKVITAIAMAYDLEQPLQFFQRIAYHLHPEGVAIVQFQDLEQQMRAAAFDNIVAEHLEYYTLGSLGQILGEAGLWPADVRPTPINGGSLRVVLKRGYVRPADWPPTVQAQLARERQMGLAVGQVRQSLQPFDRFRQRIEAAKQQILTCLEIAKGPKGEWPIDAYGASTKGNTLLQVLGLGPREIRQVSERSPEKWGRYTVTGIPIVPEDHWRKGAAPVTLVPIWQFKGTVLEREQAYLKAGGQLLFPLPYAEVVSDTWPGSDR